MVSRLLGDALHQNLNHQLHWCGKSYCDVRYKIFHLIQQPTLHGEILKKEISYGGGFLFETPAASPALVGVGFIVGPILCRLFLAIWEIYGATFKDSLPPVASTISADPSD